MRDQLKMRQSQFRSGSAPVYFHLQLGQAIRLLLNYVGEGYKEVLYDVGGRKF